MSGMFTDGIPLGMVKRIPHSRKFSRPQTGHDFPIS